MKTFAIALSLFLSGSAFAGGPTRAEVKQGFSKKAVKMYDRATRTGQRGTSTDIVSEKDHFSQRINHAGMRTDLSTISKGQYVAITAVQRESGKNVEQVTRNYRERNLLGKLLRVESTVGYRLKYENGGPAQKTLIKNQKRLVIGGLLKIPLPGDGKAIIKQVQ